MHKCSYEIYILWKTLLVGVFLLGCLSVYPQASKRYANRAQQDTIVDFKDRWSFRTNAVDWLLTVPNVAVEFDLSNSVYNKWTLSLEGKWNWQTAHNYLPYNVFNLWEVRTEARKYWRTEYRGNVGKLTLKERLFSKQRKRPRYWRAYYLGVYAHAGNYSFKFGNEGVQGDMYGAGVSGGYSIPLYSYRENYIDIEFGGSVGVVATKNYRYKLDRENNAYVPSGQSKGMHVVPFPVVTDLRVSFIYRFSSIKDKYKRVDYVKIQARQQRKMEKKRLKDSIRTAEIIADSLQRVRKAFVKDSIKQARIVADSLEEVRRAFVKDSIRQAEIIADSLEQARKMVQEKKEEPVVLPEVPADSLRQVTDGLPADSAAAIPLDIPEAEPPGVENTETEKKKEGESPDESPDETSSGETAVGTMKKEEEV